MHKADSTWEEILVEGLPALIIMYFMYADTFAACTLPMSQLQLEKTFSECVVREYEMFCKLTGPCGMQALGLSRFAVSQVH